MKKYFLLGAVALLATTSANATTDYAEVTAKATIEVAEQFECNDIDFGKIVVKQNNEAIEITPITLPGDGDFISMSGTPLLDCSFNLSGEWVDAYSVSMYIKNSNSDEIYLSISADDDFTLQIPANVSPGDYIGAATITVVDGIPQ